MGRKTTRKPSGEDSYEERVQVAIAAYDQGLFKSKRAAANAHNVSDSGLVVVASPFLLILGRVI